MATVPGLIRRFRWPNARHRLAEEFQQERRFHLDMKVEELMQRGISEEQARRQATAEFGCAEALAQQSDRIGILMEVQHRIAEVQSDLRFGWRMLWKHSVANLVAILALAVGIGLNATAFTLFYGTVLTPLPYQNSDRLVAYWPNHNYSEALIQAVDDRARAVKVAGYSPDVVRWTNDGQTRALTATRVSEKFFQVLNLAPALGNGLDALPTGLGDRRTVVISSQLWRQLGSDSAIVGQVLQLNKHDYEVLAVLPETHSPLVADSDLWIPIIQTNDMHHYQDMMYLSAIGRIAENRNIADVTSELKAILNGVEADYPGRFGAASIEGARVTGLHEHLAGGSTLTVTLLFFAATVLMIVALTNVTSLVMAQASGRRQEFAIRSALGSGRRRLFKQLTTEGLLLGILGAVVGAVMGFILLRGLTIGNWFPAHWLFGSLPNGVDSGRLLWTAILTSAAFGLLIGLSAAHAVLRQKERCGFNLRAGPALGAGNMLLGIQVCVATVVSLIAILLLRSHSQLQSVDPGFNPDNVLAIAVAPPGPDHSEGQSARPLINAYTEMLEQLSKLPGVEEVGMVTYLPLAPGGLGSPYRIAGEQIDATRPPDLASVRNVSSGYFRAMDVKILEGRNLRPGDGISKFRVGLINQAMAQQIRQKLPGSSTVVDLQVRYGDSSPWFTIVGVVEDVRQTDLRKPAVPEVYLPYQQTLWQSDGYLVVRKQQDAGISLETLRNVLMTVNDEILLGRQGTVESFMIRNRAGSKALASAFALFSILAVILAAAGVYAVTHNRVRQRRFEFGVRLAVGATPQSLVRLALLQVLRPCLLGAIVGILISQFWLGQLLGTVLFETRANAVDTSIGVLLAIICASILAAYGPARRAAGTEPLESLRDG